MGLCVCGQVQEKHTSYANRQRSYRSFEHVEYHAELASADLLRMVSKAYVLQAPVFNGCAHNAFDFQAEAVGISTLRQHPYVPSLGSFCDSSIR